MSKAQAQKIIKRYAEKLKAENYPFSAIYLFGSYAKGNAHQWSDLDVAVITDKLKKNYEKNRLLLRKLRRDVDDRIEPHGFTVKEFKDGFIPLVHEIKETGIKVI